LIRNSHTYALRVEVSSVSTPHTLDSVPASAKQVVTSIERVGVDLAYTIIQDITSIARLTSTSSAAPSCTEITDNLTNSIGIFPPSLRTDLTNCTVPERTA